jgi:hypothetical protein
MGSLECIVIEQPAWRPCIAVSTNSCPDLCASELAEMVQSCGGDGVELRVGKGHVWESDGAVAVVDTGINVVAIASSRIFGVNSTADSYGDVYQAASIGACLRCFLDARYEYDSEATLRAHTQVATVQRILGDHGRVAIEPHPGYASTRSVAAFCVSTGAHAVLDTYAVHRLGIPLQNAVSTLSEATRVLHVKGFKREDENGECHRCLMPSDLPDFTTLVNLPRLAAVVVETRARSTWCDLRLLRRWAEAHAILPASHEDVVKGKNVRRTEIHSIGSDDAKPAQLPANRVVASEACHHQR